MKRFIALIAVALILISVNAFAAETVTDNVLDLGGGYARLAFTWTSHVSDGTADGTSRNDVNGWIIHVETDPTSTTTDNYDVVLNDKFGYDIMGGSLTDLDQTNTERNMPLLNGVYGPVFTEGPITLGISTVGNSKTGVVYIYYLEAK